MATALAVAQANPISYWIFLKPSYSGCPKGIIYRKRKYGLSGIQMDAFSHALWGGGLFGYRGHMRLALFFGVFPDLASFGLWLPSYYLNHGFVFGPPPLELIPAWVITNYNFSHSLVVAGTAVALAAAWKKEIAFAMLGWILHIFMDAPFHSIEYFPTHVFWPVSEWTFDGIAWSNPWIWFPNVAGLIVLYFWRWRTRLSSRPAK